jgi:hypothetical protein
MRHLSNEIKKFIGNLIALLKCVRAPRGIEAWLGLEITRGDLKHLAHFLRLYSIFYTGIPVVPLTIHG